MWVGDPVHLCSHSDERHTRWLTQSSMSIRPYGWVIVATVTMSKPQHWLVNS